MVRVARCAQSKLFTPLLGSVMNRARRRHQGALFEVVLRWAMMSLASATGSVVNGVVSWRVTGVLNRSAAWRMERGNDASC